MPVSWDNFFLAQVGAAAALGGLLFVSLSLNLTKILAYGTLPGRGLDALILLMTVLVLGSVMLMPNQSPVLLGVEALVVGILVWIEVTRRNFRVLAQRAYNDRRDFMLNMVLWQVASLPYIVGGGLLLASNLDGLYFIAAAMVLSFVKAAMEAWVLLVEINR